MTDTPEKTFCATMLSPALAIEAGYNLYLTGNGDEGSQIFQSAVKAVAEFDQLVSRYPANTKEGIYCLHLRMAANSLAKGIARRKKDLEETKQTAEEELHQMIAETSNNEKVAGRFKAIWTALLAGGVIYFLAPMFGLRMSHGAGTSSQNLTLGLAIAGTLGFGELRAWMSRRIKKRIFATHKRAVAEAIAEFTRSAGAEYALAANMAKVGWQQMTNTPLPVTEAFENLLKRAVTNAYVEVPV